MPEQPGAGPKIIVDSDWKNQAQAEKERLAEAEAKAAASAPARRTPAAPGAEEFPPADFASLVGMLATQAVMYLGGVADRRTGQAIFDPDLARFYIDLLAVLEDKTKGNLSDAESKDLSSAVQELRMRYVELSRAVAAQMAEERAGAGPGAGAAGQAGSPIVGGPGGAPKIRIG